MQVTIFRKRKSEQAFACSDDGRGSKTSADLHCKSRIIVETHCVSTDYQSAYALCNPTLQTRHRRVCLTLRHGHARVPVSSCCYRIQKDTDTAMRYRYLWQG